MKNSREYAQRLQKLYRGLKRAHAKTAVVSYDDPIDALIFGVISERMSDPAAQTALAGMNKTFIDHNDLRVSRVEELVELFEEDTPSGRQAAATLTMALRAVFDSFHTLSLSGLKKVGKRPAREALERLQGTSPFVVDYCMLTSFQAHAIPLTAAMVEYLRAHEIVDPQANEGDIEGFLLRQVAAKNAYEFYSLLRRESESPKVAKRKTKKTKRKRTKVAKAKK
jgi:endonuclease III